MTPEQQIEVIEARRNGMVIECLYKIANSGWHEAHYEFDFISCDYRIRLDNDKGRKMKQFNLKAAKDGAPIQTRDGRSARLITYVPEFVPGSRLLVAVDKQLLCYHDDGTYFVDSPTASDLFMAVIKRTVYVNLHICGDADWYRDKDYALSIATEGCIAVAVPVEIEEIEE
jgi:hypothetical protein